MKRIVLLCFLLILVTGCTSVQNDTLEHILNDSINSKVRTTNVFRNGYSYYLPKGLVLKNNNDFNEVITDQKYMYYLYVDIVSYNNKTAFTYNKNSEAYYSSNLSLNEKLGYIEINNYKNDQYLIEIMYNYAKIEVIVYESDINKSVQYAIAILTSVTYNDSVIENYLGNDVFDFSEEAFDIFEIVGSDNYLEFIEEDYTDDTVRDPDYVS